MCQIQRHYEGIRYIGPVCEITHTDIDNVTRRLVSVSVPLPSDYRSKKGSDSRLVIVSGTDGGEGSTEVIDKVRVKSLTRVECLSRYLTW